MAVLSENKIKDLISGFEGVEVEFKSAKGGLPESLWESLSAFANTNGGVIILDINELVKSMATELDTQTDENGTQKTEQATEQVTDTVTDTVKMLLNVLGDRVLSRSELMQELGLKHKIHFLETYLNPALKTGVIEPTEKPNHPRQKYRRKK